MHRGWVVPDGGSWRIGDDAAARISKGLGLDVTLDAASRRPTVRTCLDWTEDVPHLAGGLGAALLTAMLDAGWIVREGTGRALTVTRRGAQQLRLRGIQGVVVDESGCDDDNLCASGTISVTVAGAEDWGALVERATSEGWAGISALAGHSGSVGDAVADNHSAFGRHVADTVWSVRTWDRAADAQRTFAMSECEFCPGGSRFSLREGVRRYDILDVAFLFRAGTVTAPLETELAGLLGVAPGTRVPLSRVREAVLAGAR